MILALTSLNEPRLRQRRQVPVHLLLRYRAVDRRERVADLARRPLAVDEIQRLVYVVLAAAAEALERRQRQLPALLLPDVIGEVVVAEGIERAADLGIPVIDLAVWSGRGLGVGKHMAKIREKRRPLALHARRHSQQARQRLHRTLLVPELEAHAVRGFRRRETFALRQRLRGAVQ